MGGPELVLCRGGNNTEGRTNLLKDMSWSPASEDTEQPKSCVRVRLRVCVCDKTRFSMSEADLELVV